MVVPYLTILTCCHKDSGEHAPKESQGCQSSCTPCLTHLNNTPTSKLVKLVRPSLAACHDMILCISGRCCMPGCRFYDVMNRLPAAGLACGNVWKLGLLSNRQCCASMPGLYQRDTLIFEWLHSQSAQQPQSKFFAQVLLRQYAFKAPSPTHKLFSCCSLHTGCTSVMNTQCRTPLMSTAAAI